MTKGKKNGQDSVAGKKQTRKRDDHVREVGQEAEKAANGLTIHCAYDALVKVSDLRTHPKNPNQHPREQIDLLAKVMQSNGIRQAICVSKLSGFITRGHGRLLAARKLKLKEYPVDFQDYKSEKEEIADLVADNKIQDYSYLDIEKVSDLLGDFDSKSFDVGNLGFMESERDLLFQFDVSPQTGHEDQHPPNSGNERASDENTAGKRKQAKFLCPRCGWSDT